MKLGKLRGAAIGLPNWEPFSLLLSTQTPAARLGCRHSPKGRRSLPILRLVWLAIVGRAVLGHSRQRYDSCESEGPQGIILISLLIN